MWGGRSRLESVRVVMKLPSHFYAMVDVAFGHEPVALAAAMVLVAGAWSARTPNVRHASHFRAIEREARLAGRGLWGYRPSIRRSASRATA